MRSIAGFFLQFRSMFSAARAMGLAAAATLLLGTSWPSRPLAAATGRTQASVPRHRRALLVAVTGYRHASSDFSDVWPELNTLPDVLAIKSELIRRFHYAPADIKVLSTPAETTHASIVSWFRKWLIEDTAPGRGDEIYFHYSGHGGEAPNDGTLTGDLEPFSEPDGFDRTLIPSDYGHKNYYSTLVPIPKAGGKPVCNEIRDTELKHLLVELAGKKPGDVFLTFDCCHAGGNTRGGSVSAVRGDTWHGPAPKKAPETAAPRPLAAEGNDRSTVAEVSAAEFPGFVVLAATNRDQLDMETIGDDGKTHMGALSYALCQAMDRATPATSYRDLMSEVDTIMAIRVPAQTPQIEGPIDRAIFDGAAVPAPTTIDILLRDPDDPTEPDPAKLRPVLQAGFLQGMTKGSTVALHWRGDPIDAAPFATAKLADVTGLESTLAFDALAAGGLTPPRILAAMRGIEGRNGKPGVAPRVAYATLAKHLYLSEPLAVQIDASLPAAEREAMQKALAPLEAENWARVETSGRDAHWDLRIQSAGAARQDMPLTRGGRPAYALPANDKAFVIAREGGGYIVPSRPGGDPSTPAIVAAVRGEARRRLFASLTAPATGAELDTKYQVEVRFVPVEIETVTVNGKVYLKNVGKDKPMPPNGRTEFAAGEAARLEIRNVGQKPAYVTILNLRADGSVRPVYPLAGEENDNLVVCPDYTAPAAKRPWQRIANRAGKPAIFRFSNLDDNGVPFSSGADIYKVFVTKDKADFRLLVDPEARTSRGGIAGADSPLGRLLQRATSAAPGAEALEAPPSTGWTVNTVTYNVTPATGTGTPTVGTAKP